MSEERMIAVRSRPPRAPGFITLTKAETRKQCDVNIERICVYGQGADGQLGEPTALVWLTLAGRKSLLWVTESMDEVRERIAAELNPRSQ